MQALTPFIVSSWHGHRGDPDLPDVVRQVWQDKFRSQRQPPRPGPAPGRRQPAHSNVDIAIVDPEGNLVHWFDAFPPGRGPGRNIARATLDQLQVAHDLLELSGSTDVAPLRLPDLVEGRGIRAMVTLHDERMPAYAAPVVENVPLQPGDWQALAWSERETTVEAGDLFAWLSQVYPPGVMERTDPRSKEAFRIERVNGRLSLTPAGRNDRHRFMRLTGRIRLQDQGKDGFSYEGDLAVVLAYPLDHPLPVGLQGFFEGQYPRYDRMQGRTRSIPLTAVFELTGDGS